jgi:hypothetical protein
MKVGISVRIDVTKIDKERLYKGAKGTYLDLTTFVDTAVADQYENNGFISQSQTKEEREAKVKTPILGNVKVFYTDSSSPAGSAAQGKTAVEEMSMDQLEDDIPF